MKRFTGRIVSITLACSSIALLILDSIFKPFLTDYPEVRLIIILLCVISAYHTFLTFVLKDLLKLLISEVKQQTDTISSKIDLLKESTTYSELKLIEKYHGSIEKNIINEVWIVSNELQESNSNQKDCQDMLKTIYDNITKNHVQYYYTLPDNAYSKAQVKSLETELKLIHKKKKRKVTGCIYFRFDSTFINMIPTSYYDLILYVNCYPNGEPYMLINNNVCEGYHCFTSSKNNNYYYQHINSKKTLEIREIFRNYNNKFVEIKI